MRISRAARLFVIRKRFCEGSISCGCCRGEHSHYQRGQRALRRMERRPGAATRLERCWENVMIREDEASIAVTNAGGWPSSGDALAAKLNEVYATSTRWSVEV